MNNIHVLPTDKPSRLHLQNGNLVLHRLQYTLVAQHIYITSDEYIGISYYLDGSLVRKGVVDDKDYWEVRKDYKKIILTTDQDLIKDGVQAIDDEFLEWFVKNPSCEKVEVLFACRGLNGHTPIGEYKIIIPKEEPKQETLEEAALKWFVTVNKREIIFDLGWIKIFEAGANWQQERMYSEEEVKKISADFFYYWWSTRRTNTEGNFDKWFEQFKKK